MRMPKLRPNFLALGLLLGCFFLLYFNVILEMIRQWWEDSNYSHGFLIPFVSGFLVWRKWDKLAKLDKRPSNLGFLVLFLGLLLLILGHLGAEFFTKRFSMLVVVFGLLLLNLGNDHIKILFFPLAFLIFMIPLPYILYDSIAFPLQMLALKVATSSLDWLGIRVLREGNIIHLSTTFLEVQEACSGIRSLVSLLALTTFYSYLTQNGILKRVILILSAIPIAVILNAFRVTATGVLTACYGENVAQGFFHEFSGLLTFLFAMPLIICVGKVISILPFKKSIENNNEI